MSGILNSVKRVIVVGAGLAGLVCARTLHRAGRDVIVFEATDGIGGRVRTDAVDGFLLDRGFQVLFTAYPGAKRQLGFQRLDLQRFDPGAVIAQGDRRQVVSDPVRDPASFLPSILASIVPQPDKLLTARLTAQLCLKGDDPVTLGPDETTEQFLRRYGFSSRFIDNFIRPFFGGIFLRNDLQTSARAFCFDWRMLSLGATVLPGRGMGQIPLQIAEELLREDRIRLNAPVQELLRDAEGGCIGVRLQDGQEQHADAVVTATDAPEISRLTGVPVPKGSVGTVTLYFAGNAPLWRGRKILLNANRNAFVNNAAMVSNIAPAYAPRGKHLLSVTILGVPGLTSETLFQQALHDLRRMLTGDTNALALLESYQPLAAYRIPYAQFAQPPGIYATLPANDSGTPGLVLAGEYTQASSINGAIESGEKAAALLLA